MKFAAACSFALLAFVARPALADGEASDVGCASTIDFRIVGSWISEDGIERRQFLPESKSQTPDGLPVTTEACMATADDLQEVASVEFAPHMHALTETHYHLGFIGLDRVMVTFPNGVVQLFRRIAAGPQHVIDAVTHRHRS